MEKRVIVFKLGQQDYGLDISQVKEIRAMEEITRVPRALGHIEGIINLRGNIITIINLAKWFAIKTKEKNENPKIMIVEIEGNTIGFLVDSVSEVLRLSSNEIEPASVITNKMNLGYIKGIGKKADRLIILLDLAKLISEESLIPPK
jgi:purine-binding chemotaxis protein CheW